MFSLQKATVCYSLHVTSPEKLAVYRTRSANRYATKSGEILAGQHRRGMPCRGCGVLRSVNASDRARVEAEGGPLCHDCRRKERARLSQLEAQIRERRVAAQKPRKPRTDRRAGRGGTGNARYRRNRLIVLSASDICGICGHPGAATIDHIISAKRWIGSKFDFDDIPNLQPAHGSLGRTGMTNRCTTCGRLCNQSKGAGRAS